jgi:hypothetical protein
MLHQAEAVLHCARSSSEETEQNEWNHGSWSRIMGAVPEEITVNWATWGRPLIRQPYIICRISVQTYWRARYGCPDATTQEQLHAFSLNLELRARIKFGYGWDSAVGIATGYGLDDRGFGVRVPVGSRIFSSPCRPDRLWALGSPLSNAYRELSPCGVKRLGREADHSPPTNAKVKKTWIYTFTPPYA